MLTFMKNKSYQKFWVIKDLKTNRYISYRTRNAGKVEYATVPSKEMAKVYDNYRTLNRHLEEYPQLYNKCIALRIRCPQNER